MAVDAMQTQQTGEARWTKSAAVGLAMPGIAAVLMVLGALIWGMDVGGDLIFFGIVMVISFVSSFLVLRFGTWAKAVGIVASLLLAAALFWTAFGLAAPASFFDFVPGILVLPGVVLALASNIGGIVAARRGHRSDGAVGGEARVLRVVLVAVVALSVLSAAATVLGRSTIDVADGDVTVTMKDFEFTEQELSVAAGSTLAVRNEDPFLHTFTIEGEGIDESFGPSSSKLIELSLEPGTYTVICRPHTSDPDDPSEDDMAMQLTVE